MRQIRKLLLCTLFFKFFLTLFSSTEHAVGDARDACTRSENSYILLFVCLFLFVSRTEQAVGDAFDT